MAHEETIFALMQDLVISDKHTIGDLMAHKGLWTKGTSSVNNSYKALTTLSELGKLVRGDGYFKLPGCQSEYKEHARLLTKNLAEIIKLNHAYKIIREPTLNEIGLRPDALVFLTKGSLGLCFVLEVCNNETEEYLKQKINAWRHWDGANPTLSSLFGTTIKTFDIVVAGETVESTFAFNDYLKEVGK